MKKRKFSLENRPVIKTEIRAILIDTAKSAQKTITYGELTERIVTANFLPMSTLLHELLTEISKEEDSAGGGMLSAVVVRQDREMNGFIEVAAQLGRDVSDPEKFWDDEIERVCKYWAANDTKPPHLS